MPVRTTRRERVRDATVAEIKRTARALLVAEGPEALTVRAIARDMGMSAPALYRYFASYEDLLAAVCEDVLDDLTAELAAARDAAGAEPFQRMAATCRAFRRWALAHREEFRMVFATPATACESEPALAEGAGPLKEDLSFGAVFLGIFAEIWQAHPFPVPADDEIDPRLAGQLRAFAAANEVPLPLGVLQLFLSGWVRLFGAVTLEMFGHLSFALDDPEPMFEAVLAELAVMIGAPRAALAGLGP